MVSALAMGADAATAWGRIADGFGAMGLGWALFMVVATVLMVANLVLEVFAVMSIGAEGRWNHLGFGAPMIGFVIVYVANQVVSVVSTVLIPLGIDSRTGSVQMRIMLPELIDAVRTGTGVTYVGMGALITGPIVALLMAWWAIRSIERRTSPCRRKKPGRNCLEAPPRFSFNQRPGSISIQSKIATPDPARIKYTKADESCSCVGQKTPAWLRRAVDRATGAVPNRP